MLLRGGENPGADVVGKLLFPGGTAEEFFLARTEAQIDLRPADLSFWKARFRLVESLANFHINMDGTRYERNLFSIHTKRNLT